MPTNVRVKTLKDEHSKIEEKLQKNLNYRGVSAEQETIELKKAKLALKDEISRLKSALNSV